VLLDTGPSEEEVADIEALFRDLGMDASAEGHSYGGPPPSSAFLIVVNAPLVELLDTFAVQGDGGPAMFQRLGLRLLGMRADEGRWGRPHGLRLEDSHGGLCVLLPHDLPVTAYVALLGVDLSEFDRSSPPATVEWHRRFQRWQAYPTVGPRRVGRRLPARRRRAWSTPGVRQLHVEEIHQLWSLVEHGAESVITWQRAQIVLWSGSGWSVGAVARKALISESRVTAVIENFNADGIASLAGDYTGGKRVQLSQDQHRATREIAERRPVEFGLPDAIWTAASLAEFLVTEGVVEDVDLELMESLLPHSSIEVSR
jgi:transposase